MEAQQGHPPLVKAPQGAGRDTEQVRHPDGDQPSQRPLVQAPAGACGRDLAQSTLHPRHSGQLAERPVALTADAQASPPPPPGQRESQSYQHGVEDQRKLLGIISGPASDDRQLARDALDIGNPGPGEVHDVRADVSADDSQRRTGTVRLARVRVARSPLTAPEPSRYGCR